MGTALGKALIPFVTPGPGHPSFSLVSLFSVVPFVPSKSFCMLLTFGIKNRYFWLKVKMMGVTSSPLIYIKMQFFLIQLEKMP